MKKEHAGCRLCTHLFSFHEQIEHAAGQVAVAVVEEGSGQPQVAHTPGTSDSMHVLLNVGGQVKVDHVLHMGNVQPTGRHCSGHQNGRVPGPELLQSVLALALAAIAMNGGHRIPFLVQEVLQRVGAFLRLDKDQRQTFGGRLVHVGHVQQVQQERAFVVFFHPNDLKFANMPS